MSQHILASVDVSSLLLALVLDLIRVLVSVSMSAMVSARFSGSIPGLVRFGDGFCFGIGFSFGWGFRACWSRFCFDGCGFGFSVKHSARSFP